MGGFRSVVIALVVMGLLAAAAPAAAAEPGEIGGQPSNPFVGLTTFKRAPKFFPRPESKPIVIGAGPSFIGRIELIAQDTTIGLCTIVYQVKRGSYGGECPVSRPFDSLLRAGTRTWNPFGKRPRTFGEITAIAAAEVTSVVTALDNGRRHYVRAIPATPDASILQRLHVGDPFSFFHTVYRGCLAPDKTISIAYDAAGTELGRFRGKGGGKRLTACSRARHGRGTGASGNTSGDSSFFLFGFVPPQRATAGALRAGPSPRVATFGPGPRRATVRWRRGRGPPELLPSR